MKGRTSERRDVIPATGDFGLTGVLVVSQERGEARFFPVAGSEPIAAIMNDRALKVLAEGPALDEWIDYLFERANGQRVSWSRPEKIQGTDLFDAGRKALDVALARDRKTSRSSPRS